MHGDEISYVVEAIRANWVCTVGTNIDEVKVHIASYVGCKYALGLSCGTTSLHLAARLGAERLYGQAPAGNGTLAGGGYSVRA